MAAVAAVFSRLSPAEPQKLALLLEAAPHRGGQGAGQSLGLCAVGVIDHEGRSEASVAGDGRLVVAYAGTLDNADDIALIARNGGGAAETPAQHGLAAWHALGEGLPSRLRGVFACIISDGSRLWAFRDPVGLETLFYRESGDTLFLASEAKQVLRGAGVPREPDVEAVEALFYGDLEDPTRCPLRGVRRLVGATLLAADGDSVTTRPYWNPEALLETGKLSAADATERLRELLGQAVRRTLTGHDVISLSGGIDSPPIATFADRVRGAAGIDRSPHFRLSTRRVAFPESDESRYIELVADDLKFPLHTYEPQAPAARQVAVLGRALRQPVVHMVSGGNRRALPSRAEARGSGRS